MLDFINKLNKKLYKNPINIYEIEKAIDKEKGIENLLMPLYNDIGSFVDEEKNLKKSEKEEKLRIKKEKDKKINDFNPNYINIVELLKYRNKKYNNNGTKEEGYKQCYYDNEKYMNRNYENDFNTKKGFSPLMCSDNRYKYLP